jgi:hypothetical protein
MPEMKKIPFQQVWTLTDLQSHGTVNVNAPTPDISVELV